MLKRMQRGYTIKDITQALTSLSRSDIPFGVSLMFGAPGETPATISETLGMMDRFQVPQGIWVTIGICLWTTHQKVLGDARADGQFVDNQALFSGTNYISSQLPRDFMEALVESLRMRENYTVQVNKLYADDNLEIA